MLSLSIDTGLGDMIPTDEQVEAIKREIWGDSNDSEYPENIYFLAEGDRIFEPETLTAIDKVRKQLKDIPQIGPELSPSRSSR